MQVAKKKWYEGRQGRVQFLKCQVISIIVFSSIVVIPTIIEAIFPRQSSSINLNEVVNEVINPSNGWIDIFTSILYLVAIGLSLYISVPSISKRLHDLELSAKWLPLYIACNVVLYGLPWVLLAVMPGDKESNKYGEIPK